MAKVTIESLAQRIAELERRPRSLNEDFQLEAYRMLAERLAMVPVYQVEGTVEKDENGSVTRLEWVDSTLPDAERAWNEFGLMARTLYAFPAKK